MNFLTSVEWAGQNHLLLALIATAVGIIALIRRYYWQRGVAHALTSSKTGHTLLRHFSAWRKLVKSVLFTLGLIFLALALASPRWEDKEVIAKQRGRDLIFAIDISRSMLAEDVHPSRLELAKRKIKQIVHQLSSDRVGLIVFSGDASFQCPITTDFDAFDSFLDALDVETISSGTTRIDLAIEKALSALKNEKTLSNKLLIVITDGEDFSGRLTPVAQEAAASGLHVFALGIGTEEGAPIPLFDEEGNRIGHQRDAKGTIVFTRLNEPLLKDLTQKSGAEYVQVTTDDTDINRLLNLIQQFKAEEFADKTIKQQEEGFYLPASASLICLLLEWVI